jgi:hypothetical protein
VPASWASIRSPYSANAIAQGGGSGHSVGYPAVLLTQAGVEGHQGGAKCLLALLRAGHGHERGPVLVLVVVFDVILQSAGHELLLLYGDGTASDRRALGHRGGQSAPVQVRSGLPMVRPVLQRCWGVSSSGW